MISSAWSHGTSLKSTVTEPLTCGSTAMFSPVSAAKVRMTSLRSASLRLSEIGSPVYTFSPALSVRPESVPPSAGATGCGAAPTTGCSGLLNTSSPAAGAGAGMGAVAGCVTLRLRPFLRGAGAGGVCAACAVMRAVATGFLAGFAAGLSATFSTVFSGIFHVAAFSATTGTASTLGAGFGVSTGAGAGFAVSVSAGASIAATFAVSPNETCKRSPTLTTW